MGFVVGLLIITSQNETCLYFQGKNKVIFLTAKYGCCSIFNPSDDSQELIAS